MYMKITYMKMKQVQNTMCFGAIRGTRSVGMTFS